MLRSDETLGYYNLDEFWIHCNNLIKDGLSQRKVSEMYDIPRVALMYNLKRLNLNNGSIK